MRCITQNAEIDSILMRRWIRQMMRLLAALAPQPMLCRTSYTRVFTVDVLVVFSTLQYINYVALFNYNYPVGNSLYISINYLLFIHCKWPLGQGKTRDQMVMDRLAIRPATKNHFNVLLVKSGSVSGGLDYLFLAPV
jgi:hypothetical protein